MHRDGDAAARAWTKPPLPHRHNRVLVESRAEFPGNSRRAHTAARIDLCLDDDEAFDTGAAGLV